MDNDDYEYYYHKCQVYARECTNLNHIQLRNSMFCKLHDQVGTEVEYDVLHQPDQTYDSDDEMDFESEIRIKIIRNLRTQQSETEEHIKEERQIIEKHVDNWFEKIEKRSESCKNNYNTPDEKEKNWDSDIENPISKPAILKVPFFSHLSKFSYIILNINTICNKI